VIALGAGGRFTPTITAPPVIVLVELFTSEGCSSCPPADALLRRLIADQPINGVTIVGLGSHVDYWDRLGWRDPFSSAQSSQRQSSYGMAVFSSDRIYTPQIVVDGSFESVGSNEAAIRRNILRSAQQPKAAVDIAATLQTAQSARIDVRVALPDSVKRSGAADLVVALTEDGLVSQVRRGENGGRTLMHSAVVRLMKTIAHVGATDRATSATAVMKLDQGWNAGNLRVVAFVQEQSSRRVLGVGAALPSGAAEAGSHE
ncbi:MAG: DUF1223 domain-containing protein, partial [Acidobacteriota bacterium]